jgi:hypothetical protein
VRAKGERKVGGISSKAKITQREVMAEDANKYYARDFRRGLS